MCAFANKSVNSSDGITSLFAYVIIELSDAERGGVEITGERIAKIEDTKIKEGDTVYVRFLGADKRGKTRMSMVGIDQKTGEEIKK